jgi:hypothetical protein
MTTLPVHSRILIEAARRALAPLGVRQRGRSRLWIDDHGWWLIVVEFQPSGWSKGSYLNVGVMWLWQRTDGISFDFSFDSGPRLENHKQFVDEASFALHAEQLAQRAAVEVVRYRSQFPDITAVADVLKKDARSSAWARYHAAIAAGLAGRPAVADAGFKALAGVPADYPWQDELRAIAAELRQTLRSPEEFGARISSFVRDTRDLLKLTEWNGPLPNRASAAGADRA